MGFNSGFKGLINHNCTIYYISQLNIQLIHKIYTRYKFQSNTTIYYTNILKATCFDSTKSSSGLLKNRSNVSKFVVHSGIPKAFGIPECTINFDTLDLSFRRPDDDSVESKHVALRIFV